MLMFDPALLASSATILCDSRDSFCPRLPMPTFRTRFLGAARSCLLEDASFRALKDKYSAYRINSATYCSFCCSLILNSILFF